MTELLSDSLWAQCTELTRNHTSVRASIAYVGKDGAKLLPLNKGDEIVVDGSRRALQAGSTHPAAIATWVKRGVRVYSKEGLHAKVVLFDHNGQLTAVVGSANASAHSAEHLIEAAVKSQDQALAKEVAGFLDLLVADSDGPLDIAWVEKAKTLYRPPTGRLPRRQASHPFPGSNSRLWVCEVAETAPRPSREANTAVTTGRLDYDSSTVVEVFELVPGDERRVRVGDGIVAVDVPTRASSARKLDGRYRVFPPAVVLRAISHRNRAPEAIIASDSRHDYTRWSVIRQILTAHHIQMNRWVLLPSGGARDEILSLWQRTRST